MNKTDIDLVFANKNMVYCSVLEPGNLVASRSKTDVVLVNRNDRLVCFDPVRDRVFIVYYFAGSTIPLSGNETLATLLKLRSRMKEKLGHD